MKNKLQEKTIYENKQNEDKTKVNKIKKSKYKTKITKKKQKIELKI